MTDYAIARRNLSICAVLVVAGWMALGVPSSLGQAGAATTPSTSLPASAGYVPTMTFDVASVRKSKPDANAGFRVGGGFQPPNSSNMKLLNNNLMNLILSAYEVNPRLLEGIPRDFAWATFNVEAKSDSATDEQLAKLSKEQVRLEQEHMMQVLLAERFKLKVHWGDARRADVRSGGGEGGKAAVDGRGA